MGSRVLKDDIGNDCICHINSINENNVDLINIDKLQTKVLKEMIKELQGVKEKKSDKILYRLPAINLWSYSLFY